MEELKKEYNKYLENYKKGLELSKENPNDEKIINGLKKCSEKMDELLLKIENATPEEIENGFKIEKSKKITKKELAPVKNEKVESNSNELTASDIRKYLVNGQGTVTDGEVKMFIEMCKVNNLNPFNKDAYLIKYGSEPASIITSKDVFFKRAINNPNFNGMESGIVIVNKDGKLEKRDGHIYIKGETIVGAWCKVYRKDWEHPMYQEVNFEEYSGKTKTGELNKNWKTRPAVMITKVAEATALRKTFTESLQGMYLEEEREPIIIEPTRTEQPTDIL